MGSEGASEVGDSRLSVRRTKGDSSESTSRVRRAEEARRFVGRGREIVLGIGCKFDQVDLRFRWGMRSYSE